MQTQQGGRIDPLTGCGHAGRGHGALSLNCVRGSRRRVNRHGTFGAGMCLLSKYRTAAQRNEDRARRGVPRPECFRTHSMTEARPSGSDDPSDGPSGDGDPQALSPHLGRFRGDIPGKRKRDRVRLEPREHALRGFVVCRPESRDSGICRPKYDGTSLSFSNYIAGPEKIVAEEARDSVSGGPSRNGGLVDDATAELPPDPGVQDSVPPDGFPSVAVSTSASLGRSPPKRPPPSGVGAEPAKRR